MNENLFSSMLRLHLMMPLLFLYIPELIVYARLIVLNYNPNIIQWKTVKY